MLKPYRLILALCLALTWPLAAYAYESGELEPPDQRAGEVTRADGGPVVTAKGLPQAMGSSYQWIFMSFAGVVVVLAGLGLLVIIKRQKNISDVD